ncbi:flagellar basal body rod protein FlgB [Guptibacillus algicola]|uniref:flagellar basal body rod protein FlgB n=1 Tax=Guptibacillus algicola TaxID=225844 RepID=UPI001CD1AA9A|nr:flagellar basal body rod protein FlgB [Alkalihalobacillus algicola]MCA0988903.1 flagellar basal body rod protein FlgB [Alkalihalobacillus algicola]
MKVFQSINPLQNALNASMTQQRTITSNISNVDTSNYKRKTVSFQENLQEAVSQRFQSYKSNPNHVSFSTEQKSPANVTVKTDNNTLSKSNKNNVDMDVEMAELAKNQLWYNSMIEKTNSQFRDLQTAIRGS